MTDSPEPQPFDERAALQELERLADKIVVSRRQRQQALAEFEAFVRTFKQERLGSITPTPAGGAAATPAPVSGSPAVRAPTAPAIGAKTEPIAEPTGLSMPHAEILPRAVSQRALSQVRYLRAGLAAVGALVIIVLLAQFWRGASPDPAGPVGQSAPAVTPSGGAATPDPAPVASRGPARALNIELTTLRPVWTRVIVDDRKTIERELPGGERIPLGADRSIVIRAGDAGAIRLTVDGRDQGLLGRDGQIATRTLTAPQRRAR